MKALCFLLLCYIVPLFSKCGIVDPPLYFIEYKIHNNSSHKVQISLYLLGKRQNPLGTTLSNAQNFSKESSTRGGYLTENPGTSLESLPALVFFTDSLVLVFDGKKRAIFTYDGHAQIFSSIPTSTVNLLRHSSYTDMGRNGVQEYFQYTVTEADYERAEPCDPCD